MRTETDENPILPGRSVPDLIFDGLLSPGGGRSDIPFVLALIPPGPKPPSDPQYWLSDEELSHWEGFRSGRRRDFLLGRQAAKVASAAYLNLPHPQELSICNDGDGRPFLNGVSAPSPSLSLAHGGGGAVAVAYPAEANMGVDIEPLSTRTSRLRALRSMVNPQEGTAPAEREVEFLYRIWSLKEALGKALGTGLAAPYPTLALESLDMEGPLGIAGYRMYKDLMGWSLIIGGAAHALAGPVAVKLEFTGRKNGAAAGRHYVWKRVSKR